MEILEIILRCVFATMAGALIGVVVEKAIDGKNKNETRKTVLIVFFILLIYETMPFLK